jgi:hypothetical protein
MTNRCPWSSCFDMDSLALTAEPAAVSFKIYRQRGAIQRATIEGQL